MKVDSKDLVRFKFKILGGARIILIAKHQAGHLMKMVTLNFPNVKSVSSFTASELSLRRNVHFKTVCLLTAMVLGAGVGGVGTCPPAGED